MTEAEEDLTTAEEHLTMAVAALGGTSDVKTTHEPSLRNRILSGEKSRKPVDIEELQEHIKIFIIKVQCLPRSLLIKNLGRDNDCICNQGIPTNGTSFQRMTRFLWDSHFELSKNGRSRSLWSSGGLDPP
ncbi:hypothetical protein SEMRO_456_G146610.1 [Seminavis robusta]|uniref:Uncharacterized protein n=1 Tax=Seminavis robusta TaxID=568900 RepID=A0A9N8HDE1_9STRA|nr:hypothetical protein SEMRO_456_G146610.1 [Seminavis robusta]|eukprot:Sro456_g146610.1 n/a (130) ;mRNA; r:4515-4904